MNSRNGSFGFQVVGGAGTGTPPRVELVLPGRWLIAYYQRADCVYTTVFLS